MKKIAKKIICICTFIILCTACVMISYAETTNNDVYVYFTDDGKTLHFTSDKNKGSLIETMKDGKSYSWTKDRYDLFEKETHINSKGKEISKVITDNVTKIVIDKKIAPLSCYELFSFPNLAKIEKIKNLDTSNVSDFQSMFSMSLIKEIDLSSFKWDNCENTEDMFCACIFLEKVKLGGGKTTKLKNIEYMFGNCQKLKNIDMSQFDLQNVENASQCFENCYILETINFGNNKPNLKKINGMFSGCKKIEKIDLSYILANYSNVEDLSYIFNECANLKEIRFPSNGFDWRKLNSINGMFEGSSNIENIFVGDEKTTKEEFIKSLLDLTLTEENITDFINVDYTYRNNDDESIFLGATKFKKQGDYDPEARVVITSKNDNYIFNDVSLNIAVRDRLALSDELTDEYVALAKEKINLSPDGYCDKSYYITGGRYEYTDDYIIFDVNGTITRKSLLEN